MNYKSCVKCGKEHVAKGLCQSCYQKKRYLDSDAHKRVAAYKEEKKANELLGVRVCSKCGEKKDISLFPTKGNSRKCKACFAEKAREWNRNNPEKVREIEKKKDRFGSVLGRSGYAAEKRNYQPCIATKEELKSTFIGKCHICGIPEIECKRRLSMDHCHDTGQFRGWLCDKCNKLLGCARDSEEILIDALHYIMNTKPAVLSNGN